MRLSSVGDPDFARWGFHVKSLSFVIETERKMRKKFSVYLLRHFFYYSMGLFSTCHHIPHMSTNIHIYRNNLISDIERIHRVFLTQLVEWCQHYTKYLIDTKEIYIKYLKGPKKTFTCVFFEIRVILEV